MNDVGDRLGGAARRAAERAAGERREVGAAGAAPRPGDLYALPATAEHEVEWLVVAAAGPDRWVVLPADLAALGGGADVEVPADEPGGPLTIYGRFPVRVPASLLAADRRTGRVDEARRAAAERRWREIAGGHEPPPHEADFDPDHRRRLAELAAAQAALAAAADDEAARPPRSAPSRFRPPPWMTALAAALALAVVALAGWNLALLREVERLSGARRFVAGPEITVDVVRGDETVQLPAADVLGLTLAWAQVPDQDAEFRFSVLDAEGEELTVLPLASPAPGNEVPITVPGSKIRPGGRFRLVRVTPDGGEETLFDRPIRVEED